MLRITSNNITELKQNEVFVFGSNAYGHHIGGAAKTALEKFGAEYGNSEGMQGDCYAINTMSGLKTIKRQVETFILHAKQTPSKTFLVTEIGCGIAGYSAHEIANLFKEAVTVENIHLSQRFWNELK